MHTASKCACSTPFTFPFAALRSAITQLTCGITNIIRILLSINTSVAIGTASATAVPASLPLEITKDAPIIVPETISGGLLAPTGKAPSQTSSSVAPTMIPICKSPRTSPTSGEITSGRSSMELPIIAFA